MRFSVIGIIPRKNKILVAKKDGKISLPSIEFKEKNKHLIKTLFRLLQEEIGIRPIRIKFIKRIVKKGKITEVYLIEKCRGKIKPNYFWIQKEKVKVLQKYKND